MNSFYDKVSESHDFSSTQTNKRKYVILFHKTTGLIINKLAFVYAMVLIAH